jgi:hypothetical protein
MRSFTIKAALAAALVSTAFAGAFAEAQPTLNTPQPSLFDDLSRGGVSPMTTGSVTPQKPAARPVQPVMPMASGEAVYRPRLAQIVREVDTAKHRIAVDRHDGYLNNVEARKVEAQAQAIHATAVRTAENHRGALPSESYHMLQARVAELNHTIHHYATNA